MYAGGHRWDEVDSVLEHDGDRRSRTIFCGRLEESIVGINCLENKRISLFINYKMEKPNSSLRWRKMRIWLPMRFNLVDVRRNKWKMTFIEV